jgi:NADP-dependent 3-hydroxy acid dehydrogenase YdfG
MDHLTDQVAVVTGASKGMGRHFVTALTAQGARVACLSRASAALDSLNQSHGDKVLTLACDVSAPDEVSAAIETAARHFGRIDILVNNAGFYHPFPFADGDDALIRRHIDVNLLGVIWTTRAALGHLRASRGQIVAISSESVTLPFPMLALYAATKAAVETLYEGLRAELRSEGVRVSVLRSGSVAGGSGGEAWSAETRAAFFAKIVQTGHAAMTGAAATPQSMADALIAVLRLPRDVSADLISVRAACPGAPAGVSTVRAS